MRRRVNYRRWLVPVVAAWLILSAAAGWQARQTAMSGLETQLRARLPGRIQSALVNRVRIGALGDYLVERVNSDLARLPVEGILPVIRQCSGRVRSLEGKDYPSGKEDLVLVPVQWLLDGQQHQLTLGLRCRLHWPWLLLSQLGIVLGGALAIAWLPLPLAERQRAMAARFRAAGHSGRRARQLARRSAHLTPQQGGALTALLGVPGLTPEAALARVDSRPLANLTEEQLPWLRLGLALDGGDPDRAASIATAREELVFRPDDHQVLCHGLPVTLPVTAFFYYYWYALRRVRDPGGWFVNPPTHRPDRPAAEELVELMENHRGNARAINDLRQKGLRARVLDQNRSKVKEELVRVMGEELAAPYLFRMERDPATARYRYRLALDPERIVLP